MIMKIDTYDMNNVMSVWFGIIYMSNKLHLIAQLYLIM